MDVDIKNNGFVTKATTTTTTTTAATTATTTTAIRLDCDH